MVRVLTYCSNIASVQTFFILCVDLEMRGYTSDNNDLSLAIGQYSICWYAYYIYTNLSFTRLIKLSTLCYVNGMHCVNERWSIIVQILLKVFGNHFT